MEEGERDWLLQQGAACWGHRVCTPLLGSWHQKTRARPSRAPCKQHKGMCRGLQLPRVFPVFPWEDNFDPWNRSSVTKWFPGLCYCCLPKGSLLAVCCAINAWGWISISAAGSGPPMSTLTCRRGRFAEAVSSSRHGFLQLSMTGWAAWSWKWCGGHSWGDLWPCTWCEGYSVAMSRWTVLVSCFKGPCDWASNYNELDISYLGKSLCNLFGDVNSTYKPHKQHIKQLEDKRLFGFPSVSIQWKKTMV